MEKTQLGQGLFVATRVLGIYEDVARLSQDVVTEQTRVNKGTARPGSIWRIDSGEAAKTRSGQPAMQMADGRVSKLRPSCLRGYAAGKGGRSERLDALQPSLGKVEAQDALRPLWNIPLGRPLGEPGSIPLVHPGLRERTPRFLRQRNTGKT